MFMYEDTAELPSHVWEKLRSIWKFANDITPKMYFSVTKPLPTSYQEMPVKRLESYLEVSHMSR